MVENESVKYFFKSKQTVLSKVLFPEFDGPTKVKIVKSVTLYFFFDIPIIRIRLLEPNFRSFLLIFV